MKYVSLRSDAVERWVRENDGKFDKAQLIEHIGAAVAASYVAEGNPETIDSIVVDYRRSLGQMLRSKRRIVEGPDTLIRVANPKSTTAKSAPRTPSRPEQPFRGKIQASITPLQGSALKPVISGIAPVVSPVRTIESLLVHAHEEDDSVAPMYADIHYEGVIRIEENLGRIYQVGSADEYERVHWADNPEGLSTVILYVGKSAPDRFYQKVSGRYLVLKITVNGRIKRRFYAPPKGMNYWYKRIS